MKYIGKSSFFRILLTEDWILINVVIEKYAVLRILNFMLNKFSVQCNKSIDNLKFLGYLNSWLRVPIQSMKISIQEQ